MASVSITRRETKSGPRWVVRYRIGGRTWPERHAGSFRKQHHALARCELIEREIAYGRDPEAMLRELKRPKERRMFSQVADAYAKTRIDMKPNTFKSMQVAFRRILLAFGSREPTAITPDEVQEWVTEASKTLAPASVRNLLGWLRLVLDHAEVEPNPARSKRVKLPRQRRKEVAPPDASEVLEVLARLAFRYRLPIVVLEQTGFRSEELLALTWADVDMRRHRLRVSAETSKTDKPRLLEIPDWLAGLLWTHDQTVDRRPEQRVFQDLKYSSYSNALRAAVRASGVRRFTLHTLRHRRISLWHAQNMTGAEASARAGHVKTSNNLDIYSHVLIDPTEITREQFLQVLTPPTEDERRTTDSVKNAATKRAPSR